MSDPFKIDGPAVISFSGGRTSGYMLWRILQAHGGTLPADVKVIFCNTGKERLETLDFVERCSAEWGVPVTWLEYRYEGEPMPPLGGEWREVEQTVWGFTQDDYEEQTPIGTKMVKVWVATDRPKRTPGKHLFAVVDYATASRKGEPFERLIMAKNMLPNVVSRFCTVEMKIRTSQRYLKSLGWEYWTNCIGFRADEPHRVAKLNGSNRHSNEDPIAPLHEAGVSLEDVTAFWKAQPFDLQLQSHEGNCDLCFLKGQGKIERMLKETPGLAEWWVEMETRIVGGRSGSGRFRNDRPPYRELLKRSQRASLPMMGDDEPDELSIACHCTD